MYKIMVLGAAGRLHAAQQELLASCRMLVGGRRLLALAGDPDKQTIAITPLASALPAIREALTKGDVGVLASGDPLFFGIGRCLIDEFGPEQVEVHPALSSMQEAMARFKLSWDDAALISLHGRTCHHVPGLLLGRAKSVVFTDKSHTPAALARKLIDYLGLIEAYELLDGCRIMVAENLGSKEERIYRGRLQDTAGGRFSDLSILCLLRPDRDEKPRFGLTESDLAHSRGLITKDEVRAVTLHRLSLPQCGVFWDVGAGSGSVSIEAARMNPDLTIYAIERKEEELANIKTNIRNHGCFNVVPVPGQAPDVLPGLPDPQRVFIGGNGGQLAEIVGEAACRLPKGGMLVANAVIGKTARQAPELMRAAGLATRISTLNVTRTTQAGETARFNRINIIAGRKVG